MTYIFDIETNGLLDTLSKIHCLCYFCVENGESRSLTKYSDVKDFIEGRHTFIGHNIIRYDIPALKKVLGVNVVGDIIDTLSLSWILNEERDSHSLQSYGEDFGVEKPKIEDWDNLKVEDYIHRCSEDVKINTILWNKQIKHLKSIYYNDDKNLQRYFKYLRFKMECVEEQERVGLRVDKNKIDKLLKEFISTKERKSKELFSVMPKVPIKKIKVYKDAYKDENGLILQKGDLFFDSSRQCSDITEEKIIGWEDPNPNSHIQIKKWLFSLGWVPQNIKFKRNKDTNEIKQIPQIKDRSDDGICESVKKLYEKQPKLEALDGLFILGHRISILEGFLENMKGDRIYPSMDGLTNTLRLQHRVVVNLPRADRPYGQQIRDCIIKDDGDSVLCGSDLSGIEDSTKRHFIYIYDPEYVKRMDVEGYDSHLEMAIRAKYITEEESDWYKEFDVKRKTPDFSASEEDWKKYENIKEKRYKAKTTNFAALYKSGALTLSRTGNMKVSEAKNLLKVYWQLNKAVLDVENSLSVKEVNGKKWLFNPISRFWYSLRADKDRFSTLNQGTAVFIFDKWLTNIKKEGVVVPFQYHDEWATNINKKDKSKISKIIKSSIETLNNSLKLNVKIKCSVEFGNTYGTIH